MRSRSPYRRQRENKRRSPRKRSDSSASPVATKNVDTENKEKSERRNDRHTRLSRKSSDRQESRSKHHSRHDKDSSKSKSEQKPSRKDDSRKYSGSVKRKSKGSRSRSLDKKRPKMEGHKGRGSRDQSKSLERKRPKVAGPNDKSSHVQTRSLDKNRPKGGGRKKSGRTHSTSCDDAPIMSSQSMDDKVKKKNKIGKRATNMKEESRVMAYEESEEPNMVRKRPATQKRFDQSNMTLNERFSQFYEDKQLTFDESISIEIERTIDGDEPFVIPNFHPHEVLLSRRSEEGKRSLSSRKEFNYLKNEEQYGGHTEERVVTVVKSFDRDSAYETTWYKISQNAFGHGESSITQPTLFWKDSGRDAVIQVPIVTSQKTKETDVEVTSASDYPRQRSARAQTRRDDTECKDQRSLLRPRDSWHASDFQECQEMGELKNRDRNLRNFRGRGNRFGQSGRGRPFDSSYSKVGPTAARGPRLNTREEEMSQPAELPDFSRRPDKYTYDAWKDKPEMIPRGRSYFEHDNRDEDDQWQFNRNFGRGGFVRGGRGHGFRGRGLQNFQNSRFEKRSGLAEPVQWKHDKFETLLEDEKPSSTTEK